LIVLAFLSLPVFIILKNSLQVLHYAFFFYLIYAIGLYAFYRNKLYKTDLLRLKREEIQEKMNSHEREILRLTDLNGSLEKKTRNYQRLEKFTEDLNNETFLDSICDIVVSETFGSFGAKGNVLLYLLNEKTHKLELRAIKKEIDTLKIQEKMGDLFDQWALRHNKPLLVEDAMSDFRFNPDRIKMELSRPVGSLICVPLVTETSSLGILRIDSAIFGAYQSDDLRFLNVIADIAKLSIENAVYFRHMQELSITDGLTGIFLRRYALERLKEEFIRAQRAADPLSFLMLDIDHFKRFNDSFGHMGGDIVLKKVAKFLKDFFDLPGSIVARYGGEEFCVILPHARKEEAMRLAESYRLMLSEHEMTLRKERVSVTVSIGVAAFPEDAPHYEDLVRCSDDALFKAKRSGRNKVCSI
jgi:diguanylate cyclase (GGDEF)-like protein